MQPRQSRRRGISRSGPEDLVAEPHGVSELAQLALWMSATLSGMVSAVMTVRLPFFRALLRKLGLASTPPEMRKLIPTREQSLPMLAEAIVGSSKSAIASVFGPRGAAVLGVAALGGATYWQADTWYYPMPKSGPLAMAIEFAGEDARQVEFLRAPEV